MEKEVNLEERYNVRETYGFCSNEKNARQLFFGSIVQLPVLLALMMIHKNYSSSSSTDTNNDDLLEEIVEIVEED